jgi:hypothetical protein
VAGCRTSPGCPGEEKNVIGHYRDFKGQGPKKIIPAGLTATKPHCRRSAGCPTTARWCWNCAARDKRHGTCFNKIGICSNAVRCLSPLTAKYRRDAKSLDFVLDTAKTFHRSMGMDYLRRPRSYSLSPSLRTERRLR